MDIEQGFIGGILNAPEVISEVYEIVKPSDFTDKRCGMVYGASIEIVKSGGSPDLLTVAQYMAGAIDLGWLSKCYDDHIFKAKMPQTAKTVKNASIKSVIKKKAKTILDCGDDVEKLLELILDLSSTAIYGDTKTSMISDVVTRFRETVSKNAVKDYGTDTGYMFLEDKYIRYMPGHVWVVGAKTSAGKTACLVDMLCRLHETNDARSVVISTEMVEEQNTARIISRMTGYHSNLILAGKITDGKAEVEKALDWINGKKIDLFDDLYEFQDIEMKLRQLKMSGPIDVVFIDYIQNMTWRGSGSEYEKTNNIAKGLQRLAKQLKTCIVCLSQLSNSTARGDHANLEFKGGGELAAVADLGVILKRNPTVETELGFVIEKNRHGRTGKQVLQFVNNFTRLKEIVDHEENR